MIAQVDEKSSKPGKIYAAMIKVLGSLRAVPKDGWNPHFEYNYRGIDQVFNAVHGPFAEHGVFVVPEVLSREATKVNTANGKPGLHVVMSVKFTFYGQDGSNFFAVATGEGIDSADKASNKAMQAAFKYCLIQTFCMATVDMVDADEDSNELELLPAQVASQLEALAVEFPDEQNRDGVAFRDWLPANLATLNRSDAEMIIDKFSKVRARRTGEGK